MYDSNYLISDLNRLERRFRFIDLFSVGESVCEKKIYAVKLGRGEKKFLITAAEDGMQYLSAKLLMRFTEGLAEAFAGGARFFGRNTAELFADISLFVLPMINPDGVDIALHGLDITNAYHRRLISMAGIHSFCRVWCANANGVELSHNFSAECEVFRKSPAPGGYGGELPLSEPEMQAVCEFAASEDFSEFIHIRSSTDCPYYDYSRTWRTFSAAEGKKGTQVEITLPGGITDAEFESAYRNLAAEILEITEKIRRETQRDTLQK